MAITTNNLVFGPAEAVYRGAYGATEPAASAIGSVPASATWTDLGSTFDGVKVEAEIETETYQVDQSAYAAESRVVSSTISVTMNMSEHSFTTLQTALCGGTEATGTNYSSYSPADVSVPTYYALILDGPGTVMASGGVGRRRLIVRKVCAAGKTGLTYSRKEPNVIEAKLTAHYVSSTVAPFVIVTQTAT